MSIIIRTRDGKEFTTHHLWEDFLTNIQKDIWIPIWEPPTDDECEEPCTALIRSADIMSISATTEEDRKRLHALLDWADIYGGN